MFALPKLSSFAVHTAFERYGQCVANHHRLFLYLPLIFTFICSLGFIWITFETQTDYLFVPEDSKFRRELDYQNSLELLPTNLPYPLDIQARSKIFMQIAVLKTGSNNTSQSNMLLPENLNTVTQIISNFTKDFYIEYEKSNLTYDPDICKGCAKDIIKLWSTFSQYKSKGITLTYPYTSVLDHKVSLYHTLLGVNLVNNTNQIGSASIAWVQFPAVIEVDSKISKQFSIKAAEYWDFFNKLIGREHDLRILWFTLEDRSLECIQVLLKTAPFLTLTALLNTVIAIVTVMPFGSFSSSKLLIGLTCMLSVMISVITTLGLLLLCGFSLNATSIIAPFLVISIGLDDCFILLSCWEGHSKITNIKDRIRCTMGEAGVAITVTTVTDAACFSLGCILCTAKATSSFCLVATVGVIVDYVYQTSIFLVLLAKIEEYEQNSLLLRKQEFPGLEIEFNNTETESFIKGEQLNSMRADEPISNGLRVSYFLGSKFSNILVRPCWALILFAVFIILNLVNLYICTGIYTNDPPSKFTFDNSVLYQYLTMTETEATDKGYASVQIIIAKPPDFRNRLRFEEFERFTKLLESIEDHGLGVGSTPTFPRAYLDHLHFFWTDIGSFYDQSLLLPFLQDPFNYNFLHGLRLKANISNYEPNLQLFSMIFLFKNVSSRKDGNHLVDNIQRIIDKYPIFKATQRSEVGFMTAISNTMIPSTLQTIGCAIIALNCVVIPIFGFTDWRSIFSINICLLSISCGVLSTLVIWAQGLDGLTIAGFLVALGTAVDFLTHVAYKYTTTISSDCNSRIRESVSSVGWPILQAALTTIVGILPLAFVPTYMVRIFFKMGVVVIVAGVIHAFFMIPVIIKGLEKQPRNRFKRVQTCKTQIFMLSDKDV